MSLEELGYNKALESHKKKEGLDSFEVGRVISEHKERYIVKNSSNEFNAELIGNLRFTAENRLDLPAVGDWVAFTKYDEGKALIHAVYPRYSIIERKAVGKLGHAQIIATNIDFGLIVQAVDRDFNINRLERYLTICNASKIDSIIILSKIDLIDPSYLSTIIEQITQRINEVPVVAISNLDNAYKKIEALLEKGKTYCLLGSSGVGKSTLLNNLSRKAQMKTGEISTSVNKGKHITSHRELIVLENGSIVIDNPGMREVGIADSSDGVDTTFGKIIGYANKCRYKDCTHIHEEGCEILSALESKEIDKNSYTNFIKIQKEKMHFESTSLDRKKKDKNFGKMVKNFKKQRKNEKY